MQRKQKSHRRAGPQLYEGNAWRMPSAAAAKTIYHTLLSQFLDQNPSEWSLVSCFFMHHPVLAFLWGPTRTAALADTVAQAVNATGGQELEAEAKQTLLTQLLARRGGLHAKEGPFDTLTAHHPKGKPVWDLED